MVNMCLLSTVNRIREKMYREYNVIISIFLKASLQDSFGDHKGMFPHLKEKVNLTDKVKR